MKKLTKALLISILMLVLSCSGSGIKTDFDYSDNTKFEQYQSYAWLNDNNLVDVQDGLAVLDLPGEDVNGYIDKIMKSKGIKFDNEKPDFLMLAHFGVKAKTDYEDESKKPDDNYVVGRKKIEVEMYAEGSIVIDIIDSYSFDLIWRGTATKESEDQTNEEKIKENIQKSIDELLKKFPPKK